MLDVSTFPIKSLFWKVKLITETIKEKYLGITMGTFHSPCHSHWIDCVMTDTYDDYGINATSVKQLI